MILSKRAKDITGQRFGALTAIRPDHLGNKNTVFWEYLCDCGAIHVARGNTTAYLAKRYKSKIVPSCGCGNLKIITTHGRRSNGKYHPLDHVYGGIKNRCYNPNDDAYKWYGAKGVTLCKEWLDNSQAFFDWAIANDWKKGLHLDKDIICREKGISPTVYSPATCQWVSAKTNVGFATNRANYGSHPNVKLSYKEVAEILFKHYNTNLSAVAISKQYNVSSASIRRLINIDKKERVAINEAT